jgi:hypothetical protein
MVIRNCGQPQRFFHLTPPIWVITTASVFGRTMRQVIKRALSFSFIRLSHQSEGWWRVRSYNMKRHSITGN